MKKQNNNKKNKTEDLIINIDNVNETTNQETIQYYINKISKFPLLTKQEENNLFQLLQKYRREVINNFVYTEYLYDVLIQDWEYSKNNNLVSKYFNDNSELIDDHINIIKDKLITVIQTKNQQQVLDIINTFNLLPISLNKLDNVIKNFISYYNFDTELQPKPIFVKYANKNDLFLCDNDKINNIMRNLKLNMQNLSNTKQKIIESNLRLVISIANDYKNSYRINLMDLIQEGNIGLMKAVEMFDPGKGFKFSTYAVWWIRQYIKTEASALNYMIKIPSRLKDDAYKVYKFIQEYTQENNIEPNYKIIAEHLNISEEKARDLLNIIISFANISLDQPIINKDYEEDTTLGNLILQDNSNDPEHIIEKQIFKEMIMQIVNILEEPYKTVIKYRFGFVDNQCYTLEDVGQILQMSREKIRQIEKKAIRKLKFLAKIYHINDFLN